MAKLLLVGHELEMLLVEDRTFRGEVISKGIEGFLKLSMVSIGDISGAVELSPKGVVVRVKEDFIRMVKEALEEALEKGEWYV